jgi:hypothetical protein
MSVRLFDRDGRPAAGLYLAEAGVGALVLTSILLAGGSKVAILASAVMLVAWLVLYYMLDSRNRRSSQDGTAGLLQRNVTQNTPTSDPVVVVSKLLPWDKIEPLFKDLHLKVAQPQLTETDRYTGSIVDLAKALIEHINTQTVQDRNSVEITLNSLGNQWSYMNMVLSPLNQQANEMGNAQYESSRAIVYVLETLQKGHFIQRFSSPKSSCYKIQI